MKQGIRLLVPAVLWFLGSASACPTVEGGDTSQSRLAVTGNLNGNRNTGYFLRIKVTNKGSSPIKMLLDYLPWRSPLNLRLVAIPLEGMLDPVLPLPRMINPTVTQIILHPGETIEGEIELARVFTDFETLLARSEIAIFWSFTIETLEEGLPTSRHSGLQILTSKPGLTAITIPQPNASSAHPESPKK